MECVRETPKRLLLGFEIISFFRLIKIDLTTKPGTQQRFDAMEFHQIKCYCQSTVCLPSSQISIKDPLCSPSLSCEFCGIILHIESGLFLMTINCSSATNFLHREPFVVLHDLGL